MNDYFSDIIINAQTVLNDLDKVIEVSKAIDKKDKDFLDALEFIRVYLIKYFSILKRDKEKENDNRN